MVSPGSPSAHIVLARPLSGPACDIITFRAFQVPVAVEAETGSDGSPASRGPCGVFREGPEQATVGAVTALELKPWCGFHDDHLGTTPSHAPFSSSGSRDVTGDAHPCATSAACGLDGPVPHLSVGCGCPREAWRAPGGPGSGALRQAVAPGLSVTALSPLQVVPRLYSAVPPGKKAALEVALLEALLDLVDRYWSGCKSLHDNEVFQGES